MLAVGVAKGSVPKSSNTLIERWNGSTWSIVAGVNRLEEQRSSAGSPARPAHELSGIGNGVGRRRRFISHRAVGRHAMVLAQECSPAHLEGHRVRAGSRLDRVSTKNAPTVAVSLPKPIINTGTAPSGRSSCRGVPGGAFGAIACATVTELLRRGIIERDCAGRNGLREMERHDVVDRAERDLFDRRGR